jgi:hypothetical protein
MIKRKDCEVGECAICGKKTRKRMPIKPYTFYCGCEGPRAI